MAITGRGAPIAFAHRGASGYLEENTLPAFERALAAGEYRLRDVLEQLDVAILELDETELANVNEPADLERLTNRVRSA